MSDRMIGEEIIFLIMRSIVALFIRSRKPDIPPALSVAGCRSILSLKFSFWREHCSLLV
jgi:hypothetical protein